MLKREKEGVRSFFFLFKCKFIGIIAHNRIVKKTFKKRKLSSCNLC